MTNSFHLNIKLLILAFLGFEIEKFRFDFLNFLAGLFEDFLSKKNSKSSEIRQGPAKDFAFFRHSS